MAWGLRTVLWAALIGASFWHAGIASGQSAKKGAKAQDAAAAAPKDSASAQKSLETGIKSFEAGKHEQAVALLSSAITSGGLPSQQMARALYYRGVAYRKSGKPAQAISDLTSALWLKGGLSDNERAQAMENRAGAYREAGLVEPTQIENARNSAAAGRPSAVSEKAPALPAAAQVPAQPQRQATVAATSGPSAAASSWQSTTAVRQAPVTTAAVTQPAPAAAPVAASPPQKRREPFPDGNAVHAERQITPYTAAVREQVATAPSASEQVAAPAPTQSSSLGGGMFKGLFGDLSLGGKAPARPEPVAAPVPAPAASTDWSQATKVVAPGGAVKQAAAAPAPVAAPQPEGNYRLQVAAVRTRGEADGVAAKLRQQHGKELKSRGVEIDEATLANVGTFYRVRVGPYVDANEPRNLCVKLRQKGYDCLVVSISQ